MVSRFVCLLSIFSLAACANTRFTAGLGPAHMSIEGSIAGHPSSAGYGYGNGGPTYSGGPRVLNGAYPARHLEPPTTPGMIHAAAERALGSTPDGSQPTWNEVQGPQDIPQSPDCHFIEGGVTVVNGQRFMNVRQACEHPLYQHGDVGIPQFAGIPGS